MSKYFTRSIEGCEICGVDKRPHAQLWSKDHGWHTWKEPSKEMITTRMRLKYGLSDN